MNGDLLYPGNLVIVFLNSFSFCPTVNFCKVCQSCSLKVQKVGTISPLLVVQGCLPLWNLVVQSMDLSQNPGWIAGRIFAYSFFFFYPFLHFYPNYYCLRSLELVQLWTKVSLHNCTHFPNVGGIVFQPDVCCVRVLLMIYLLHFVVISDYLEDMPVHLSGLYNLK